MKFKPESQFIAIIMNLLLAVNPLFGSDAIIFQNVQFLETRMNLLQNRQKADPQGEMVNVEVCFENLEMRIFGKESTYTAITSINYANIKDISYELNEKSDVKVKIATVIVHPMFIFNNPKVRQHWVSILFLDDTGEQKAIFNVPDSQEMKFKWLIQERTNLPLKHFQNGNLPTNFIAPGMSAYQILALLGDPLRVAYFGETTIFYYEQRILGIEAKLFFEKGKLVDLK